ncbi:Aldo/keto reductase [Epithele typhae]|uniref:Aldo/keto reductase n=1 Tax=Epithele typhae TaxID=378194 RepID=UPI0020086596|nr:Aldo/keto reductase [Epithele typhae]KAH9930456.1 Aldo/keto reductase [Epithele typhae]
MSRLMIDSTVHLPRSGIELPLLGLGVFRNEDPQTACLAALKRGYRHIDSARMYYNEAQVGEAVRNSGLPREEVFITSKIGNSEHGYERTKAAVVSSLGNFKFAYIDLMLMHSAMSDKERRLGSWRALVEAKAAGQLRSIGVSNYNVKHMEEIRIAGYEMPDVNQIELHPLCQQKEIVDYCNQHGIVIEAYTPLIRARWDYPVILETAAKLNKGPAEVLVRWSLQRGFVPLPKSSNPDRVVSNADVYDFELSDEDMKRLDALDRGQAGAVTWNPINVD